MVRPIFRRVATGIDTLEVNGYGVLNDYLPDLLDVLQESAKAERDDQQHRKARDKARVDSFWSLCGQPLLMAPYGAGEGQYRWLLTCPAALVRFGQHNMNSIAVKVRLSSAFLWEHGYRQAWHHVETLLSEFGDFRYQPSEVDVCVDVAGLLLDKLRVGDFTRRGHVVRWHQEDAQILDLPMAHAEQHATTSVYVRYGEQEGFSFSPGSPHGVVIYNKPREIRFKSQDKAWFGDIWRTNGWDGAAPVTRIEIRYKRALLHELGIETMVDLFSGLDGMWQYSTQDWIRHCKPTKEKQRARWPESAWWKVVQGAVFTHKDAAPLQRQKVRMFHEKRIISTILGYVEAYAAWKGDELGASSQSLYGTMANLVAKAQDHYEEKATQFHCEVIQKRKLIGFAN